MSIEAALLIAYLAIQALILLDYFSRPPMER